MHSGCNNFPFTPVFETPKRGSGSSAGGLAPDPQHLPPLPSDPGDATEHRLLFAYFASFVVIAQCIILRHKNDFIHSLIYSFVRPVSKST